MGKPLFVVIVVAGIIAVLKWLSKANAGDQSALANALGLAPEAKGPLVQGDDPVRGVGHRSDQRIMTGRIDGYGASIWLRSARRARIGPSDERTSFV